MASQSPDTITREHFLSLMAEQGGQDAAGLVQQLLSRAPWDTKQAFTQGDVVAVMELVSAFGRKAFANNPAALADPEGSRHAIGMLEMLEAHALPLLQREVKREGQAKA